MTHTWLKNILALKNIFFVEKIVRSMTLKKCGNELWFTGHVLQLKATAMQGMSNNLMDNF